MFRNKIIEVGWGHIVRSWTKMAAVRFRTELQMNSVGCNELMVRGLRVWMNPHLTC